MKKKLATVIALSTLTLSACSGNTQDTAEAPTWEEPAYDTAPEPAPQKIEGTIGEPLHIECEADHYCDADLTITSLETSDTCPPVDFAETVIQEDEMYLTISGDLEVHETGPQNGFGLEQSFSIIDSDGYTQPVKAAQGCDYEFGSSWETVRPGEKEASSERFIVPDNAEELVIDPYYTLGTYTYKINQQ